MDLHNLLVATVSRLSDYFMFCKGGFLFTLMKMLNICMRGCVYIANIHHTYMHNTHTYDLNIWGILELDYYRELGGNQLITT